MSDHRCYSCGKSATAEVESVGMTHRMVIWVCAEHIHGSRILTKIENGIELVRVTKTIATWEPRQYV